MFRAFRLSGQSFFLPPGTPKERVQTLQDAMRKTLSDPAFHKEFQKFTGDNADAADAGSPRESHQRDFRARRRSWSYSTSSPALILCRRVSSRPLKKPHRSRTGPQSPQQSPTRLNVLNGL